MPDDDFDKLFLAIVRQASGRPEELQAMDLTLTELIRRHPPWGIAYSIRSSNRHEMALESKQVQDFEAAVADLDHARRLIPTPRSA